MAFALQLTDPLADKSRWKSQCFVRSRVDRTPHFGLRLKAEVLVGISQRFAKIYKIRCWPQTKVTSCTKEEATEYLDNS